jgi:GTP-binding protein
MKFVDQVRIFVKSGDGGAGAIAWRREKFIPKGGPAGGDGGDGGDVILEVDPQLSTLLDYRFIREHKARSGSKGHGRDMNGVGGEALVLRVPPGTLVRDVDTGETLADMGPACTRIVIAKGGRGGLGNINFATSTNQAPRYAQEGTKGEEKNLQLELKLLADVGIIGYPNAGKSTLISVISRARPKIADYPFTTLTPNLGVAQWRGERSFVVADIPGLIEGAHQGHGLGHQFLRHVERCHVLVHLVEGANPGPGRDPAADFAAINRELKLYSKKLAGKPQVVAVTKVDVPESRAAGEAWARAMARRKVPVKVHLLSSATREGLEALLDDVAAAIWTDVSPKGGGRPKKAGRPRAAVEAPEPFVAEAAGPGAATVAGPRRTPVRSSKAAPGKPAKNAVARAGRPSSKKPAKKGDAATPRKSAKKGVTASPLKSARKAGRTRPAKAERKGVAVPKRAAAKRSRR